MAESYRPFRTVEDRGFKSLMKTGRPAYYLPSASTVSRDVKRVFAKSRQRIADMLQKYDGDLNFQTDAWTSPNHKAYVGITVTMEVNGELLTMVLDVVEVAKVRALQFSFYSSTSLIHLVVPLGYQPRCSVCGGASGVWY